jgi:hypothetical protein
LDRRLVLEPPLEVWPEVVERAWIPPDVRSILLE